jgi:hypothetical protein
MASHDLYTKKSLEIVSFLEREMEIERQRERDNGHAASKLMPQFMTSRN